MDDFFVYTSSAVNTTSNIINEQQPQDDPLVNAFANFGWTQRFNRLIDTVKKQSDVIVEVTKKDLQEFASTIRDDTQGLVEQFSHSTPKDKTATTDRSLNPTDNNSNLYASFKEGLDKISTVNLKTLRDGLSDTLTKHDFLPTQLTSIKLPDNINLGELREELEQGTRFAELYLQKFGAEVLQVLNNTITVLEPEQDNEPLEQATAQLGGSRIFASRTEALIAKLQTDHATLLMDPKDTLLGKEWEGFGDEFDVEKRTFEISTLLNDSPELRETMNDLVPLQIDYTTFWKHYFYHVWRINREEERRRLLVKDTEMDPEEDNFRWDSEEEDLGDQRTTHLDTSTKDKPAAPGADSTTISEQLLSSGTISPSASQTDGKGLTKIPTEDQVKHITGYNVGDNHDDDSDSDWE